MKNIVTFLLFIAAIGTANAQQPQSSTASDDDVIFSIVEKEAQFPGGHDAMMKFIVKNVKYPQTAIENKIEGTVYVEFVIEKNGEITNVKVIRNVSPELDEEAVRVVSKMPKWKPATLRGKTVRCRFRLPIRFQLQ
jgi:protein TonB